MKGSFPTFRIRSFNNILFHVDHLHTERERLGEKQGSLGASLERLSALVSRIEFDLNILKAQRSVDRAATDRVESALAVLESSGNSVTKTVGRMQVDIQRIEKESRQTSDLLEDVLAREHLPSELPRDEPTLADELHALGPLNSPQSVSHLFAELSVGELDSSDPQSPSSTLSSSSASTSSPFLSGSQPESAQISTINSLGPAERYIKPPSAVRHFSSPRNNTATRSTDPGAGSVSPLGSCSMIHATDGVRCCTTESLPTPKSGSTIHSSPSRIQRASMNDLERDIDATDQPWSRSLAGRLNVLLFVVTAAVIATRAMRHNTMFSWGDNDTTDQRPIWEMLRPR